MQKKKKKEKEEEFQYDRLTTPVHQLTKSTIKALLLAKIPIGEQLMYSYISSNFDEETLHLRWPEGEKCFILG